MEKKPSRSAKIRELEHRYAQKGGMEGRYRYLYSVGMKHSEIACEFGINPNTLRNYWLAKWRRQREEERDGEE